MEFTATLTVRPSLSRSYQRTFSTTQTLSPTFGQTVNYSGPVAEVKNILTEAGDNLALESPDGILLENDDQLVTEASDRIVGEGAGVLVTEDSSNAQPFSATMTMSPSYSRLITKTFSASLTLSPALSQSTNPLADFTTMQLGNNMGYARYWGPEFPFANRIQSASGWTITDSALTDFDVNDPTPGSVPFPAMSADYMPTETIPYTHGAGTYVLHTNLYTGPVAPWRYPSGVYTVEWDGTGTIRMRGDCATTTNSSGRFTVSVTAAAGLNLVLMASSGSDPVRNLRVWLPGMEDQASTWAADWAVGWNEHHIVRFMNSGQNNETTNPVVSWATRVPPTRVFQMTASSGGLALEHMVAFCNEYGKNPWVCFPARLDIDGCMRYAEFLHANLDPALTFYLEDSNEIWNPLFWQHAYYRNLGTGVTTCPIHGVAHDFRTTGLFQGSDAGAAAAAVVKYQAHRSAYIFDAIADAIGAPDPSAPRYVRTAGTQSAAGAGSGTRVLIDSLTNATINPLGGTPQTYIDAIAIAPYWGQATKAMITANPSTALSDLMTQVQLDATNDTTSWVTANKQWCDPYGIRIVAYEAGLDGSGTATQTTRMAEVRNDPLIETAYDNFRAAWYAAGAHECVLLGLYDVADSDGAWGQIQHQLATPYTQWPTHRAVVSWRAYLDAL